MQNSSKSASSHDPLASSRFVVTYFDESTLSNFENFLRNPGAVTGDLPPTYDILQTIIAADETAALSVAKNCVSDAFMGELDIFEERLHAEAEWTKVRRAIYCHGDTALNWTSQN